MTAENSHQKSPSGIFLPDVAGLVFLENLQLAADTNVLVGAPLVTLVTSSLVPLTGLAVNKLVLIRASVSARIGTDDTSALLSISLQVSAGGAPFVGLKTFQIGTLDLQDQYISATFEILQTIAIDTTGQWRIQVSSAGTVTDVVTIDPITGPGYAELTVEIFDRP